MFLEVLRLTTEPTSLTGKLLLRTVVVSGQLLVGLEAEGAGVAEITESLEIFSLLSVVFVREFQF